jgi:ribose 5-phosphate isomerase A
MSQEAGKRAAAQRAAELIENGMIVGLGTGSTAGFFIECLIEKHRQGLHIQTVPSSRHSADLAKKGGLPVLDINSISHIDITVDGADAIDPQKRMIKGGGGALLREKILASSSREMVVIIDDTKKVPTLGTTKLPVEILFYGSPATRHKLEQLGFEGKWRMNEDNTLFITENGHLIFDISFKEPLHHPEKKDLEIIQVPGVIETGFFFQLAGRVIVGYEDGTTVMDPFRN